MLLLASNLIESSKKQARVVTSPAPLDHQLPAPWPWSPTASAPGCGANFHVPSICAEKLKIGAKSKKYSFFMLLNFKVLEV
jgi:hypothetical protein